MDFGIRQTTIEDYNEFAEWWKWFRFPAPNINLLPDNGEGGFVVFNSETDENIVAGYLYKTNSKFSICEFIVSNPNVKDKTTRDEAIKLLIEIISIYAKEEGFSVVFTSLKHQNLKQKYLDCGYQIGSTNTTELIKIL